MKKVLIEQPKLDVLPKKGMFVDGKYVIDSSGSECAHVYAATGSVTTQVALAGPNGVDKVVQSARKAFPEWRDMPDVQRQKLLLQFAQVLNNNIERLAQLSTIENGMPIRISPIVVSECSSWLTYYAGYIDKMKGEVDEINPPQNIAYHIREPYGVVAFMVPFNAPTLMACMQTSAALATGNCVIVKPSSATPFTASIIAELFIEAGGPPGVFNVIPCNSSVGQILCSHPGVNKIHLTGSVAAGKAVMAAASKNLTPVGFELGGKSPAIVFNDADLELASVTSLIAISSNAGQACAKQSRFLVQSSVYDKMIEMAKSLAEKIEVGDPGKMTTEMGPVVSESQCKEVLGFIERAKRSKGCRLVLGGKRLGGGLASGYFIAPTIFADVDPSIEIFRKEVFGPVLTFTKFETEEEAIRLANDTDYGLGANVFTQDIKLAHRVALALESGGITVNGLGRISAYTRPFGGYKNSGIGRVGGSEGIREFTQTKTITIY
jgi:aldehyde dehydrogenase (NAD+)